MLEPKDIILQYDGGTGSMASVFYVQNERGEQVAFEVVFVRIHMSGSSAVNTKNALTMYVDSNLGSAYDCELFTYDEIGSPDSATPTRDVNFRVLEDERRHYLIPPKDGLAISWTNPASGSIKWGTCVGLAKVDHPVRANETAY